MKHFKIICSTCGDEAKIETTESVSYRNDTYYEYTVAVCKNEKCDNFGSKEKIK